MVARVLGVFIRLHHTLVDSRPIVSTLGFVNVYKFEVIEKPNRLCRGGEAYHSSAPIIELKKKRIA